MVAAIPLTVEAGMTGGIGLDLKPEFGFVNERLEDREANHVYLATLDLTLAPWSDIEVYASAAAGVPGLRAGARGKIVIAKASIPFTMSARTGVANVDHAAPFLNRFHYANLYFDWGAQLGYEVEALSGRFEVFAEVLLADYSKELADWRGLRSGGEAWSYKSRGISLTEHYRNAALWSEINNLQ